MAASVSSYTFASFVVLLGFFANFSLSKITLCPAVCTCLGNVVDCSGKGLTEVPPDLPHWVETLELSKNKISEIASSAFNGLHKLEDLDLSSNELTRLNASIFHHTPNMKVVSINYNNLTEVPVMGKGPNVTHLSLKHNMIEGIHMEALEKLPNLRTLDLSYNRIRHLTPGTFPFHPNLHQLILNHNKLATLKTGTLSNLTALETLKLNRNRLKALPKHVFKGLSRLKYLELNHNKISVIEGLSFQGLENLLSLKLRRNAIQKLMDGSFFGMNRLTTLHLDFNNITNVTRGWLFGLQSLQHLFLAHNKISQVEKGGWDCCELLQGLDLKNNNLSAINQGTFSNLMALKYLNLDSNRVSYIAADAFRELSSLETLNMSSNQISWTIDDMNDAFQGLVSLSRLGLNSNHIKSIAKRAFNGLERLKHLHLTDNAITAVQDNAFYPIKSLQDLRLNSSNLLCDCYLSWLPQWLRDRGFENSISALCSHPEFLKGKSIFDVKMEDFKCNDYPTPTIISEFRSQNVLKGHNLTLECRAGSSSDSPMKAAWKKDNQVLKGVEIVNMANTTDGAMTEFTTQLHIRNVQDRHRGKYQCVISNQLGSAYSAKVDIHVHVFPVFTKTPEDLTVKAGIKARLVCAARGDPSPEISWKRNGGDDFPAARERRLHFQQDSGELFITNVKSTDQGIYTCNATNDAGTILTNASLKVREKPSFVRPMERSKTTRPGLTAVLECLASGSPKPKLTWYKNDEPLKLTQRHFFTASDQIMLILNTVPMDGGRYTCEMTNTLGTERGTTVLNITADRSATTLINTSIEDDSTTTGIIIIAVVVCVVGTSLVWVIIIYQTRKRSEEYSSTPTDETTLPGEIPNTPYHDAEKENGGPGMMVPHLTNSYQKYAEMNGGFGLNKGRGAAIFPSDVEDYHGQSVPLTSDEHRPAEASSDGSISGLPRFSVSDGDTIESSSPSSHSTQSTRVMHTFQPHAANPKTYTSSVRDSDGPGVIAMVHALPPNALGGSSASVAYIVEGVGAEDGHHGSLPPGGGTRRLDCDYDNVAMGNGLDGSFHRSRSSSSSSVYNTSSPFTPNTSKECHCESISASHQDLSSSRDHCTSNHSSRDNCTSNQQRDTKSLQRPKHHTYVNTHYDHHHLSSPDISRPLMHPNHQPSDTSIIPDVTSSHHMTAEVT